MMDRDSNDTASLLTLSDSLALALYRYEKNRRHQAVSPAYEFACDSTATKLELLSQALFDKVYENGLYWEPEGGVLESVLRPLGAEQPRILDLGSGTTASWCISMATRFPHAECIGVDLIPSDLNYLPPNVTIEVADLMDGLPYPDHFFNLVHCRLTGAGLPLFFDTPTSLSDFSRVLRPGGILLLEDLDSYLNPFHSLHPNNPHLAPLNARHFPRYTDIVRRHPLEATRPAWGARLASLVRATPGLSSHVNEQMFHLPFGVATLEGADEEGLGGVREEEQVGWLHREVWLTGWALLASGFGMDEEWIEGQREKDEGCLPREEVGLYARWKVVWAVKDGEKGMR